MKQLCSSQKVLTKPSRGIEVWNKVRKEAEQEGEDEFKDERKEVRGGAGGDVQDGGGVRRFESLFLSPPPVNRIQTRDIVNAYFRRDLAVKETSNSEPYKEVFLN